MVKFLKTFFRSKRDLEVALTLLIGKRDKLERALEFTERGLKATQVLNKILQKANDAQNDTISSLQRDLAAAHAKLLIQEETPPETLHVTGKRTRKPHVHLSHTERGEVLHYWWIGKPIQDIAGEYEISERTVHRIVKEARGRDS